jgi:hypothetical protein
MRNYEKKILYCQVDRNVGQLQVRNNCEPRKIQIGKAFVEGLELMLFRVHLLIYKSPPEEKTTTERDI